MGATVNDVLVAAVAGALRRYVEARGDDPMGKKIRAMVPVDIRGPQDTKLTNRFALVYLPLPIGIADPSSGFLRQSATWMPSNGRLKHW